MRRFAIAALFTVLAAACSRQPPAPPAVDAPAPSAASTSNAQCTGGTSASCGAGKYCATAQQQCGVTDAAGQCTQKPDVCTQNYSPVCGCDGKTYSNACAAAAAGVNVDRNDECASP